MPKLRVFSGALLITLFEKHGFQPIRQGGCHVILRQGSVSFPVPLHRSLFEQ